MSIIQLVAKCTPREWQVPLELSPLPSRGSEQGGVGRKLLYTGEKAVPVRGPFQVNRQREHIFNRMRQNRALFK